MPEYSADTYKIIGLLMYVLIRVILSSYVVLIVYSVQLNSYSVDAAVPSVLRIHLGHRVHPVLGSGDVHRWVHEARRSGELVDSR
jgi:hypothetical protein